jgi:diketogulonate reductase-like aldo/keto reductase
VHADRLAENADVFDFALSDEEMALIAALDRCSRVGPDPDRYGF